MVSPTDAALSEAIRQTLAAPATMRATIFEALARHIERMAGETCPQHPWTSQAYYRVDASRIFRSGVGTSLVIDPSIRRWSAIRAVSEGSKVVQKRGFWRKRRGNDLYGTTLFNGRRGTATDTNKPGLIQAPPVNWKINTPVKWQFGEMSEGESGSQGIGSS